MRRPEFVKKKNCRAHYPDPTNAFSATTCTTPVPRFKATLSDSESTILSPASIDSAHSGKASRLTQSDAILSARTPDFDARNTRPVAHCGGANPPRQLDPTDHTGDRDRTFSPDFAGSCSISGRLLGEGSDDVSWGSVGDEGGDEVIGPRSAGINDDVEAASDARAVLGAKASNMLDFGGMGLNYGPVVSSCETDDGC